ncbi:MAG: VWA domain-containing protein [Anaerolineae bacterium]
MLKKLFPLLILCLVALPVALGLTQENPVRLEITGIDPTNLPTVVLTASVSDALGQPILGLTEANFASTVEGINGVVPDARIVSVENVADDGIPFSVVLMIDVSTSMETTPLEQAQAAARTFVNSISDNDSVALMTFSTTTQLVQDFTTDKAVLLSAIDSLRTEGQTALYQGAYDAVQQALNAPSARRVVILLSDGAEYGDHSTAAREDALQQAVINGVPVYTIGLGFGTDRSYLQALSDGTNARFVESPAEDQLVQIYSDLAALLRSQYIITMEIPVPADGQTYTVNLDVTADAGTASASGVMRAPIPVPLVEVPEAGGPLTELTTLPFTVYADDPLTEVVISQGGTPILTAQAPSGSNSEFSFPVIVAPRQTAPGSYTLDIQATDEDGDVGTASYTYEVAAIPSEVTVAGLPAPGAALEATADVTVSIAYSQTATTATTVTLNGTPVTTTGDATSQTFTLDPYTLPAGDSTLSVTTTNDAGTTTTVDVPFTVAAVPPIVTLNGLAQGDEVTAPVSVTPSFVSQAPVIHVAWFLDGNDLAHQMGEPFGVEIDPTVLTTGEHTLIVGAEDQNGSLTTVSVVFTVPSSVAQTATALAPTATPTATNTPAPTNTDVPTATPSSSPTATVNETQVARDTAAAQFAADAQATSDAIGTITAVAQSSVDAANAQATTTAEAQGTVSVEQASAMQTSQSNVLETVQAAVAQSTTNAQSTADAANAQATTAAQMTATALAQMSEAEQTNVAATQNAADALATANAQATIDAQSTLDAQGTFDANAQATQDRANQLTATAIIDGATQTAQAVTTSTAQAVADASNAQATLDAQGTLDAESAQQTATAVIAGASQTADAENAQATANAQGTSDADGTSQALAFATGTAQANLTLTAEVTPTRTPVASLTPSGELTEVEAQGAPQDSIISPLILGCGVGIVLLLIIFFVLNRRRTRRA